MQKNKAEGWVGVGMFAFALCGCGAAPPEDRAEESVAETSAALVPSAPECTSAEMTEILRPPTGPADATVRVACSFTYPSDPQSYMPTRLGIPIIYPGKITRAVEFARDSSGKNAVGVSFICKNADIAPKYDSTGDGRAITVRSIDTGAGWANPHHILIEGCYVHGNIYLTGHDPSLVCKSALDPRCSSDPGQVLIERRQATAPHHINLFSVDVTTTPGGNGIVFGKGVTYSTLTGSVLHGNMGSNTAIYLSPESANNSIVSNSIHVATSNREQIAIDGSANNYIADNYFAELNHGGIYIFRNCGEQKDNESVNPRIQKPWHNAIVNNRFYYEKFDGSDFPAVWVASRTSWIPPFPLLPGVLSPAFGHLENTMSYCGKDDSIPYGSGVDDTDNAKYTIVAQNQIRQGQHQLTVSSMVRSPDPHDSGSLPFYSYDNVAVPNLTAPLTYTAEAEGEPPVFNSLYMVQGQYLLRTDDESGVYVTLTRANWSRTTSMASVAGNLYIVQAGNLYCADPVTAALCRTFPGTWDGPTTMAAVASQLYITQDDSLWSADTVTGKVKLVGTAGSFSGVTSMTALGKTLYYIRNGYLYSLYTPSASVRPLPEVQLGERASWGGPTSMTGLAGKLYIVQDGGLWVVNDLSTGAYGAVSKNGWSGATSMTTLNGALFITRDSQLWTVNPNSGSTALLPSPRGDWAGPISMTAIR